MNSFQERANQRDINSQRNLISKHVDLKGSSSRQRKTQFSKPSEEVRLANPRRINLEGPSNQQRVAQNSRSSYEVRLGKPPGIYLEEPSSQGIVPNFPKLSEERVARSPRRETELNNRQDFKKRSDNSRQNGNLTLKQVLRKP